MFQQTFVSDVRSPRRPIGIAVSLITQSTLLAVLAVAPLLVSRPLPTPQVPALLVAPAPPLAPEKPVAKTTAAAPPTITRVRSFRLTAPAVIPKRINTSAERAPEAPDVNEATGFNAGGDSLWNGLGGAAASVPPPPMPKAKPEAKEQTGPVRLGGNVAAANLVHRVEPTYPPLAKAARIQGVVVFQAVIGVDGQIRNLQLQGGPPLLVAAAKSAILQWRYRPTLLNGNAVEVMTTITVRFALAQ